MIEFMVKTLRYGFELGSWSSGCIIFGDDTSILQDDSVKALETLVKTPVGYQLLGRVVDGIGNVMTEEKSYILKNI